MSQSTRAYLVALAMLCLGIVVGQLSVGYPPPAQVKKEPPPAPKTLPLHLMLVNQKTQTVTIPTTIMTIPSNALCVGSYTVDRGMVMSCLQTK